MSKRSLYFELVLFPFPSNFSDPSKRFGEHNNHVAAATFIFYK